MTRPVIGYLSSDVVALTSVSESYLTFLVRTGIVCPLKHRNGRTNLFTDADVENVRWALEHRRRLSIEEMRATLLEGAA